MNLKAGNQSQIYENMNEQMQDFRDVIKPEFLNQNNNQEDMNALPTEVKTKMIAHSHACTALCFNPMGDIIATGGEDKAVKLWNLKKQKI